MSAPPCGRLAIAQRVLLCQLGTKDRERNDVFARWLMEEKGLL